MKKLKANLRVVIFCSVAIVLGFFAGSIAGHLAVAQNTDATKPLDTQALEKSGKLFNVRYVPGDKNFKLFVVGKKAAQLDFNKADVEIESSVNGGPARKLKLRRGQGFVTSDEPVDPKGAFKVRVRHTENGGEDIFQVP